MAEAEKFLLPEAFSAELAPTTGGSAVLASMGTVATGVALVVSGTLALEGELEIPDGWAASSLLLGFALVNWGPGMGDLLNEQPGRFAVRGLLRLAVLAGSVLVLLLPAGDGVRLVHVAVVARVRPRRRRASTRAMGRRALEVPPRVFALSWRVWSIEAQARRARRNPTELSGRTRCNRVVNFEGAPGVAVGDVVPIRVTEVLPHSLRGALATLPEEAVCLSR